MTTIYNNSRIYYTLEGFGKPLVLLHGFLESSTIWKETIEEFSRGRQVIAIDLPGHGKSDCLEEAHTMEAMAQTLYFLLSELDIQKVDIMGHSMGGYVALAFMEKYPAMMNKIILLNSTPDDDSEERKQNRERSVNLVHKNKRAFVSMAISNLLTTENNKKFRSQIQKLKEEAYLFPTEGISKALEGMKIRKNRKQDLKAYQGEKFILAGEQDPIIDHMEIKKIAKDCNCSFYSLPDGHLTYLENKTDFFQILHFLK